MTTMTEAYTWHGRDLVGSDGDKIGTIKEIYEDQQTGKPEWALVGAGLFGTRSHFVPLAGAQPSGEAVQVNAEETGEFTCSLSTWRGRRTGIGG